MPNPRNHDERLAVARARGGRELVPAGTGGGSRLAVASLAKNTRRAYRGALRRLRDYLESHGGSLNDEWLARYLGALFDRGHAPASASMVVAAVRFQAKVTGSPSPVGPATIRVLSGFRREARERGRGQVGGIGWEMAEIMAALITVVEPDSLAALRDAALVSVMSDAMLRVSEVVALRCSDIEEEGDGAGLLSVRHSKTDQAGEGAVLFLGEATMQRVRAWKTAAGFDSGPLFRPVRARSVVGQEALSARSVRSVVQKRAKQAGIDGVRISGHSLRVGSAQSLARRGASLVELQQAGRWTSPHMPGRYVRGQLAALGPVARIRYGWGS